MRPPERPGVAFECVACISTLSCARTRAGSGPMTARPERLAAGAFAAGLALSLLLGVVLRDQIACSLVEASGLTMIAPRVFADPPEGAQESAELLGLAHRASERAARDEAIMIFTDSSFWRDEARTRTIVTPFRACVVIGREARSVDKVSDELARAMPEPTGKMIARQAQVPAPIAAATRHDSNKAEESGSLAGPQNDASTASAGEATRVAEPNETPATAQQRAVDPSPVARDIPAPAPQDAPAAIPEPAQPARPDQTAIATQPPDAEPPVPSIAREATPSPQAVTPEASAQTPPPAPPADSPPWVAVAPPRAAVIADPPTGSLAPRSNIAPGQRPPLLTASQRAPALVHHVRPTQARAAAPAIATHVRIWSPRAPTQAIAPQARARGFAEPSLSERWARSDALTLPPNWRRIDTPHGLLYQAGRRGNEGRCSTGSINGYYPCRRAGTRH
jgi:hypothetical protein